MTASERRTQLVGVAKQVFAELGLDADQWPHHGAKNHSHAEQGHSDWLLVRRQSFSHNSHCGRNEDTAREALARAADDHGSKVGGNPA